MYTYMSELLQYYTCMILSLLSKKSLTFISLENKMPHFILVILSDAKYRHLSLRTCTKLNKISNINIQILFLTRQRLSDFEYIFILFTTLKQCLDHAFIPSVFKCTKKLGLGFCFNYYFIFESLCY